VDQSPVFFRRTHYMLPLPIPERGGSLDGLGLFLNVTDLLVQVEGWLLIWGQKSEKIGPAVTRRSSPAIGYRHFSVCRFDVSLSGVRRHDQSKGANSVSATAGCILFWIMVQGSVPTDAWVLRCIIKPQSQMSMEDAFCIMTPCVTRALYGRGDLFQ
jgi:hypothetical protein